MKTKPRWYWTTEKKTQVVFYVRKGYGPGGHLVRALDPRYPYSPGVVLKRAEAKSRFSEPKLVSPEINSWLNQRHS